MKRTIFLISLLFVSILGYSQNFNNLTIRNSFTIGDSTVNAATTGDTLATKEWTIQNAAILTGNPNEIFFNSNGILGADDNFTYNPSDSILNVDGNINIQDQSILNYFGSGVKSGLIISANGDPSKFDISAGTGVVVDNDIPSNSIAYALDYAGITAVTITDLATANATYIALDSVGAVIQQTTPYTPLQRRHYIILGAVIHSNRTVINAVNNLPDVILCSTAQYNDLLDALQNFKISGNVISANGANMKINKSEGDIFKKGANFINENCNPHTLTLGALVAPGTLRYRLRDGTEYLDTSLIDNLYYDLAGVKTAVTNHYFSIQRISIFSSNLIRIQYGQAIYSTMADAIQSISTESFIQEENIAANALLIGLLVVGEDATDLTVSAEARFFESDKFGSTRFSAGGAATTTLQQAYDNSVQPQIVTSALGQELQMKQGSGADTDTVFSVLNGSDETKFSILGNGKTTINESLVVDGNIIGDTIKTDDVSGSDRISLHANGKEIARAYSNGVTEQFIINPQGDLTGTAVAPSLAFGGGGVPNTGFYENFDGNITLTSNGSAKYSFGSVFRSSGVGFLLQPGQSTSTLPVIIPDQSDTNTGIGWAGSGKLSLITNSIEAMRLTEDTVFVDSTQRIGKDLVVDGNVGIGTIPDTKLHVHDSTGTIYDIAGSTSFNYIEVQNSSEVTNTGAGIELRSGFGVSRIASITTGTNQSALIFATRNSSVNKVMTMSHLGNVSIGNTNNTYKLDVNGTGRFTGIVNFDVFPITPSSAPTTDYQVANKKYVDDNGGGFSKLITYTTDANTSGTSITDLYSYTMPANTLSTNGDILECYYTVTGTGAAISSINLVFDSDSYNVTGNYNGGATIVKVSIIRVSATVARRTIDVQGWDASYLHDFLITELTSLDFTNPISIKLRGTATSGTVTAKMGYINKF